MKGYSTLPRSQELETNYSMQFNVIPQTIFFEGWGVLPLSREYNQHILNPTDKASTGLNKGFDSKFPDDYRLQ